MADYTHGIKAMSRDAVAERIAADLCGSEFPGFAVVYTFSPIFRRIPNRRRRAQTKEQLRLLGVVGKIVEQIRASYDIESAAAIAQREGLQDCISITSSYNALIAAIA